MWDSFPKELKGIGQGEAGKELMQVVTLPPKARGVGQNDCHPRSHLHTCPFMWGCYVGQPSLPEQCLPPPNPTPLLGAKRISSFTDTDAVASRFCPWPPRPAHPAHLRHRGRSKLRAQGNYSDLGNPVWRLVLRNYYPQCYWNYLIALFMYFRNIKNNLND